MKYLFFAMFLAIFSTQINAQTASVNFAIKNAGIRVDGSFKQVTSTIVYDKKNPSNSKFSAEITANSVNTGMDMRDNHLRKDDFFDVAKYPTIKFVSTSVVSVGANALKVTGNLTVKGVTKSVTIAVKVTEQGGKTTFKGTASINRLAYTVGASSWTMADDVTLDIKAVQ